MAKEQLEIYWNKLPWDLLPASSKVDFCQLIAGIKPAVRTCVLDINNLQEAYTEITNLGWEAVYDSKGFVVISRDKSLSKEIIKVDQSPTTHALQLGYLLGYPECCSAFIEEIGEDAIDEAARKFSSINLNGTRSLLDISQYFEGVSLISHVPCSYECQDSLNSALLTLKYIKINDKINYFDKWALPVIDYFSPCLHYIIS